MLFNSLEFALFFVAVLGVYIALGRRGQNLWLLLASYTFYAAWNWRFLGLIFLSTLVDYGVGRLLSNNNGSSRRRLLLALSVVTNLGILGTFKYAGFFAGSLQAFLSHFGFSLGPFTLEVVLPVGISFYSFQTLSYTIDVYRRQIEPTRDFLDFALFVAFFPQLVAGPIERASRLLPQIARPRRIDREGFSAGAALILWGLFKKVVIGDNIAALADAVYTHGADPTAAEVLLGTYAFAIQIYCDFSGYSDIARGVAKTLGFDLMLNFHLPYLALNPADFWHRWHISLSTWLRDYLYVSLGGNRGGRARTYRNLFLTMLLGGLWHGAAWNFVAWGAFHGALLAVYQLGRGVFERVAPVTAVGVSLWRSLGRLLTFHLVCLGWVLFRAESLAHAGDLLQRLFGPWQLGLVPEWLLPFAVLTLPLVLMQAGQSLTGDLCFLGRWPTAARATVYAGLVLGLVVLGEDFGQPFIYFQF